MTFLASRRRLSALILALGLLLGASGAACGQGAPGNAPEFTGIDRWINSKPLSLRALRGKVVLIDFWTYSCINCLRTLPYLTHWYDAYQAKGLVVIGVHSPEFDFEKNAANVEEAVGRLKIGYPVAMDSELATWNAWDNQYWPAEYLIDQHGKVVLHHFGEGHYLAMENAIRQLLALPPLQDDGKGNGPDLSRIGSPEMYFGSARQEYLASPEGGRDGTRQFTAPDNLPLNQFALVGRWKIAPESAELAGPQGELRLHFKSGKLHMVASAARPVTLQVLVDGKPQPPVTVRASMLYTLFDSDDYRDHVLTLKVPAAGLRAFTFTFG